MAGGRDHRLPLPAVRQRHGRCRRLPRAVAGLPCVGLPRRHGRARASDPPETAFLMRRCCANRRGVITRSGGGWPRRAWLRPRRRRGTGPAAREQEFRAALRPLHIPDADQLGLELGISCNWGRSRWSVPVNATVSQLVLIGRQPVQFGAGVRHFAGRAASDPVQRKSGDRRQVSCHLLLHGSSAKAILPDTTFRHGRLVLQDSPP